jgi:hypothetical protein
MGGMGISLRRFQALMLALGALLIQHHSATADEEVIEKREVAGWRVIATKDDVAGVASCTVSRDDELGPILGVTLRSDIDAVFLILADLTPGKMQEGSYYDVRYVIDDGEEVRVAAQAKSQTMFLIPFGKNLAALEPLRRGHKIDFRATRTIALFDLGGSTRAFAALRDCKARYMGATNFESDLAVTSDKTVAKSEYPPLNIPRPLGRQGPEAVDYYLGDRVGSWFVEANDAPTGRFDHCAATKEFIFLAVNLTFELDSGHVWVMKISNTKISPTKWEPPLNKLLEVRLTLDDVSQAGLIATATEPGELPVELGREPIFLEQWRRAKILRVEAADGKFEFEAEKFGQAFDALRECASYYIGADRIADTGATSKYHTQSHGEPPLPPTP